MPKKTYLCSRNFICDRQTYTDMRNKLIISLLLATATLNAQQKEEESSADLMELEITASPREEGAMRRQPASSSTISHKQLESTQTTSLKGISTLVPNFFMPDYGSRLSSAVYIRGIGSRINSPAIGLYVDDVPVLDKSAFDLGLYEMQRIDILRGPQTTLYGTGTMGGVMKVYTRSPFNYQGTNIGVGYATNDNTRKLTFMHYSKPSERFAWSFGGYYSGGDGFFRNDFKGEKMDFTSAGDIRFRGMALTKSNWMLDFTLDYEISNEGAYPYFYVGRQDGKPEDKADQLWRINSNLSGLYDRAVFRSSMNLSKSFPKIEVRSITAFLHLKDSMQMDQDLLSDDIYKLNQIQKNITVSEDLLLKSRKPGRWQWITDATASFLRSNIKGPVTFRKDGVAMLNGLINQQANANMPTVEAGPMSMQFNFEDKIQGDNLLFDNKFQTNTINAAAFHQSTIHDLFGVEGLSATLGLRFNAEVQNLSYSAWYDFTHSYQLGGHLTMPSQNPMAPGMVEKDIAMVPSQDFAVKNGLYSNDYDASNANHPGLYADAPIRDKHFEVMPRVALQYEMGNLGNLYATVSRGYRSGGYNVQNISEVMRQQMTRDMMLNVRDVTLPVLNAQPMVPQETKDKVTGILNGMASIPLPDVEQSVTYNPEYAWNYEVGVHTNLLGNKLFLDASAFLTDISDLQLSQMSETGLGRIMVNAGKSRSAGLELMLKAQATDRLLIQGNYGYTHATFLDYSDYDANTNSLVECEGNYVPFMPQHTVNVDIAYTIPLNTDRPAYSFRRNSFIARSLTLGANYNGAGRIYWTEQNDAWQKYHSMLGARLTLDMHPLSISLWGRNLTNSHHNTFWFVSANRAYEQHVKPIQVGLDAKFCF